MKKRTTICMLIALLASILIPQQVAAEDYMCNPGKFYMSSSNDHLSFSLLMADLGGTDTWLSSGHVKAYNNSSGWGSALELCDLYTFNQSNTSSHRIFGVVLQDGATAFITNSGSSGNRESWGRFS